MATDPYKRAAVVTHWVDGDTIDVAIDCGFSIYTGQRLRVLGLDTPERGKDGYREATEFAQQLAPINTKVTIETSKGKGKYGRYLAAITLADGSDFTARMLAAGHGVPYNGGKRQR